MPTPRPLSQQDPRWRNVKLGSSPYTVAQVGCTVTAVAMFSSRNPDWMARNLEFVNGAKLVWKSVNKTGDLEFVWRQWSSPQARVLEGLRKGEAIILEVPANNRYGGKHWVAVKYADSSGLTVIDPDRGPKGVERYQPWSPVISSAHFLAKNSNFMPEKEQAINIIQELEPTNGQTRTKRIIDAISTGDWSYFAFEYSVVQKGLTKAKTEINELEKRLAEAPESMVVEQLEAKNKEIEKLQEEVLALQSEPPRASIEEVAEATSSKVVQKLENRFDHRFGQFVPKPSWLKWALGTLKNNSTAITGFFAVYGVFSQDEIQQYISYALAGGSFLLSAWLEWDKTKYQEKEKSKK